LPVVAGDFRLPAIPVVFWLRVGKSVRLAAEPVGARTSVFIARPRLDRALTAFVEPVPPLAISIKPSELESQTLADISPPPRADKSIVPTPLEIVRVPFGQIILLM
jgi:hypothetical protein